MAARRPTNIKSENDNNKTIDTYYQELIASEKKFQE